MDEEIGDWMGEIDEPPRGNAPLSIVDQIAERVRVRQKAATIFGSEEAARLWLRSPALYFSWRTPESMLATQEGARLVHDLLVRLDYGVYT